MTDTTERLADKEAVRYLNRISDRADQWLFFAAFILGAAAIVGSKSARMPQYFTTAAPVCLTIAYAVLAWFMRAFRLREDRIAENCYYLGLLFTLVSLGCALFAFTTDIEATRTIVTNFGIALSTTIVGLALRVLISQLREDPVEYEREARVELAEATSKLTAQLHEAVADFASFRRAMGQTLEEGMTDIAGKASKALEENVAKFTDVGAQVLSKIDSSFESFSEQARRLNVLAGQTVEALEALFRRIEAMDASPDVISRKLDPIIAGFQTVMEDSQERARTQRAEFNRISKAATSSLDAVQRLEAAVKGLEGTLSGGSDRLNKEMRQTADAVAKIENAVSGLAEAAQKDVAALRQTADTLRQSLDSDLETVRKRRDELQAEVESAQTMVTRVHSSLSSLANLVTETLSAER